MDEAVVQLDEGRAARLIAARFPQLAGEPVRALTAKGTDNHIFRIGNDLCARFPKVAWAAGTARREVAALPRFAGAPLPVPAVYGLGEAGEDYPHAWSVLSWLPGTPLEDSAPGDAIAFAHQLAAFFGFVRSISPDPAFRFSAGNNGRGAPLAVRTPAFEAALARLPELDTGFASRLWGDALKVEKSASAVWLHGDVHPGNLLVEDGRLCGVIDWGLCGVGDGACDLLTAWAMFDRDARDVFRAAIGASEAEWMRGAGWALSMAVIYLPYAYENGLRSDLSERMIARLMEEFA
jgi:aminoglycoside phosphotransferase (APT) family kinase protein